MAIFIECVTDNRNRTASGVRMTLFHGGGNLGSEGSVAWIFQKKGIIAVKPGPSEDTVIEKSLEAGAEDVVSQGPDGFEVRTEPTALHQVAGAWRGRFDSGRIPVDLLPARTP